MSETQQCLLDNLWNTRGDHRNFLDSLNCLSIYFNQQNQQTSGIVFPSSLGGVSFNPSLVSTSLSTNFLSCKHCETMSCNFIDLNCRYHQQMTKNNQLKTTVTMLQNQSTQKTSFTPLVKVEKKLSSPLDNSKGVNVQSSLLDDGESVCVPETFQEKALRILALPQSLSLLPTSLPLDVVSHIQHLARKDGHHFQEFLFETLTKLASQPPPGLSITWETHYNEDKNRVTCPKTNPLCLEIPLERYDCPCQLVFSIPKACINMQHFQDLVLSYRGQTIQVSPMTLLDHGFLRQIIFTDPEQTDRVTRKLAICINNIFAKHRTMKCQVLITSKMP